jgi:hypothetical protein
MGQSKSVPWVNLASARTVEVSLNGFAVNRPWHRHAMLIIARPSAYAKYGAS